MALSENLKKEVKQPNSKKARELVNTISSLLVMPNHSSDSVKNIDNTGKLDLDKCPICNENHIIKYGKRNNRQRYKCKICGKIFDERTASAISHTKISLDKWFKYIELLIKKVSIRECARRLHISIKTAFFMRHKIIDCLSLIIKKESADGSIISTKMYAETGEILKAEKNFIKGNKENISIDKKEICFTQNMVRYYSKFKSWIKKYRGVYTKYLSNYITLFSWSEKINKGNIFYKINTLLSKILSLNTYITNDMVKHRLVDIF